jgi:tetratricopeptide (TPR) repeat protein
MSNAIETAKKLLSEHNYKKAYSVLKPFSPSNVEQQKDCLMLLGVVAFELQKFDEALNAYNKLLSLCNEEESVEQLIGKSRVLYELSLTYFAMYEVSNDTDKLNEAINACEKAIGMCFGKIYVTRRTGFMIYNKESIYPYSQYFIQLAVLYQHLGRAEKSVELLTALKSYHIHNCETELLAVIYDELGNSFRLLNNPQIALGYYSKALMLKIRLGLERSAEYSYRNIAMCLALYPRMTEKIDRIMEIYGGDSI